MFVIVGSFTSTAACAATSQAIIHNCHDGDTCRAEVITNGKKLWMNVRLFGIDAPEVPNAHKKDKVGQPLGLEARDALNAKLAGKEVSLVQADLDPYNRPVVEIQLQKETINIWMVSQGWAEVYQGPTKRLSRADYYEAEAKAKKEKRGIWGIPNYVSPSSFRKQDSL